jgi:hypothetical protein
MCPIGRRASDTGCRIRSGCSTETFGVLAGAGFVYSAPLVGRFSIVPPVADPATLPSTWAAEPFVTVSPPTPPPKP